MLRRPGGYMSMEALALISALCIAAIFFYAHYARQTAAYDLEARHLAQEALPLAQALMAQQPPAKLEVAALKAQGLQPPPELMIQVPPYHDQASDWQVDIWHPKGQKLYRLGPQGLKETVR